ncbi:phospholysine phosphohistidine inorganic pyrophosphate phosphatase isoform X1 [Ixodes scapularis]
MLPWLKKPIRGLLLDICGVLYESGDTKAIAGSVEAVKMLRTSKIPFRFITNETQRTKAQLLSLLHRIGFDVYENDIFMCVPAAKKLVQEFGYRPYLLVHPNVESEFHGCDTSNPNCVVLGDAGVHMTYERLNQAFRVLIGNPEAVLMSLGKGKFYREHGELVLDVGPFAVALESACERRAIVIGKPSEQFFNMALEDMHLRADEVVMIGDDISSDVGAAQSVGFRGVLVRTGKYRYVTAVRGYQPRRTEVTARRFSLQAFRRQPPHREARCHCCQPRGSCGANRCAPAEPQIRYVVVTRLNKARSLNRNRLAKAQSPDRLDEAQDSDQDRMVVCLCWG